jgi:adenylate cyclase
VQWPDTQTFFFRPTPKATTIQKGAAAQPCLVADVAGFSALTERDEEGTYVRIRSLRREIIEPRLYEHQGRLAYASPGKIGK